MCDVHTINPCELAVTVEMIMYQKKPIDIILIYIKARTTHTVLHVEEDVLQETLTVIPASFLVNKIR